MEKKWIAISVILAIICACVVMSAPLIKVAYTVKEPYNAAETYYVKEPYIVKVPLEYEDDAIYKNVISNDYHYSAVDANYKDYYHGAALRNLDTIGGIFKVKFTATHLEEDDPYYGTQYPHVCSHDTEEIYLQLGEAGAVFFFSPGIRVAYEVIPPEKPVTQYHNVTKQRTVTKYRDVTKYKYIRAFEYLMQSGA